MSRGSGRPPKRAARRTAPDPNRFDDLFHHFGHIALRRMFGGEGIFVGELMIGIVIDDQIYLKAGDATRGDFEAEGARPFTYRRGKKQVATSLSYYTVPDRLLDDPEEFAVWARKAQSAAIAAKAPRKKSR